MNDNPHIRSSIRKVGGSLYLRIPVWVAQLGNLHIGDDVVWTQENLAGDFAIRLQFKRVQEQQEAVVEAVG
jgi:antitoxin component of MazEF toxin-antitoxin module